jgi:hypothetical protein
MIINLPPVHPKRRDCLPNRGAFVARILRKAIQFYQRLIPAPRCNGCWTMLNSAVQSHAKVTQMSA